MGLVKQLWNKHSQLITFQSISVHPDNQYNIIVTNHIIQNNNNNHNNNNNNIKRGVPRIIMVFISFNNTKEVL